MTGPPRVIFQSFVVSVPEKTDWWWITGSVGKAVFKSSSAPHHPRKKTFHWSLWKQPQNPPGNHTLSTEVTYSSTAAHPSHTSSLIYSLYQPNRILKEEITLCVYIFFINIITLPCFSPSTSNIILAFQRQTEEKQNHRSDVPKDDLKISGHRELVKTDRSSHTVYNCLLLKFETCCSALVWHLLSLSLRQFTESSYCSKGGENFTVQSSPAVWSSALSVQGWNNLTVSVHPKTDVLLIL